MAPAAAPGEGHPPGGAGRTGTRPAAAVEAAAEAAVSDAVEAAVEAAVAAVVDADVEAVGAAVGARAASPEAAAEVGSSRSRAAAGEAAAPLGQPGRPLLAEPTSWSGAPPAAAPPGRPPSPSRTPSLGRRQKLSLAPPTPGAGGPDKAVCRRRRQLIYAIGTNWYMSQLMTLRMLLLSQHNESSLSLSAQVYLNFRITSKSIVCIFGID